MKSAKPQNEAAYHLLN